METCDPLLAYSEEQIDNALDRILSDIESMPEPEPEELERWDSCQ